MLKIKKKTKAKNIGDEYLKSLFLNRVPSRTRYAEAFRTLRTNMQFSSMGKDFKTILITSTGPSEGKTTCVANLCYSMAQAGKTVCMIDADLRKPKLSSFIDTHKITGLTGLLSSSFDVDIDAGKLEDYSVSDIIRIISFKKKTGVLYLSDEIEKFAIYFFNGKLIDFNWVTRPKEFRLAETLKRQNLVTEKQISTALAHQKKTLDKLGFILVNRGFVKEEAVTEVLSHHMTEGLRMALQLKVGEFSFKNLQEFYFKRPAFNPIDINEVYKQVLMGEEELVFIENNIYSSIIKTRVENLFILPSGSSPPNPSELLASEQMSFIISFLRNRFDYIIIDTPPLLPASDALILAPQTDGTLFVLQSGSVNRDVAKRALDQIKVSKANLIGVVLNQYDYKLGGYYYYSSAYYDSEK